MPVDYFVNLLSFLCNCACFHPERVLSLTHRITDRADAMNLNRLPCANTHYLNRYLAELDREAAHEDAMAHYAAEIAADLMSAGYCNVQIDRRIARIDFEEFLLFVDEQDAWDRLEQDKDELFAEFCNEYAPYRAAFLED